MAGKILDWSKGNYNSQSNGTHNIWIYLGMGGYVYERGGDDYATIRDELSNNFIGAKVQEMYDNNSFVRLMIRIVHQLTVLI